MTFIPLCTGWPLLAGEWERTRITVLRRSWLADDTLHSLPEDSPRHLASEGVIGAGGVKSGWWTLAFGFEACSFVACFVG